MKWAVGGRRQRRVAAAVVLVALVGAGCSTAPTVDVGEATVASGPVANGPVETVAAVETAVVSAVVPAPTVVGASPVTVASTVPSSVVEGSAVAAVAPVAPVLPVPVPPPVDDEAPEPVVELGSIEIPSIGLSAVLYEGIRLTTFDRGPGHWPGTSMPGEFGNAVVGGHRTSGSRPFRHLDALVPGDAVVFTTAQGRFDYQVTSTEIVTPDSLRVVNQNPGFTATLFACNPVGSTRERIVVHLSLVSS
jgi:sortase A